ncbi:MAG: MerR family transcriptional regulator [Acidimicrobiales bacterium]
MELSTSTGGDTSGRAGAEGDAAEYRVDELARLAGTTVRNVRAYQDRGLLPSPRRSGRVALYSTAHLARLRLVGSLLERGYTLGNIGELFSAWERGADVADVLGLERVLGAPWSDRPAGTVTREELTDVVGDDPASVEEAVRLGLLVPEPGGRFQVPNPAALEVGRLLAASGVPIRDVLDAGRLVRRNIGEVARRFVELVDAHVVEPAGEQMSGGELRALTELVEHLRPLAVEVVEVELARAMEEEIRSRLGAHLHRLATAARGPAPPPATS